ncbi:solute carrier family 22 member 11 isoform X1 [Hyaena hyaena]|uniref:solute carrier family 22 member 11 isoform X1 n=1 Tax=Hyaena hyaena TaxID=95912 RepID=UPI0019231827|nr:solute carrier family 22 member 11 isoform X1 [Hyaena hyaena]
MVTSTQLSLLMLVALTEVPSWPRFWWDLVCDRKGLKSMGQTIYMAGLLIGSVFWGILADRFGRKWILSWSCLQVALTNTSTIFASNFFIYCGLRFLGASGIAGIILTSMMLLVEWTTTRRRATTIAILSCSYSLGQMGLGALAFAVQDWRNLQMAISMPFFAIFLISWWLPESARWLIVTGKPEQGLQELHKVARINGHKEATKSLTIQVLMTSMKEEVASEKARGSLLELFLVPMLCRRSCIMFVTCFCLVMSYYGLVLDLQNLGSDIFLLQAFFGVIDILARVTTPLLLSFLGRRIILVSFHATAGVSILANTLLPRDLQTLRVVFAVLGRGCFGIIFTCVSIYKSELYPTALRMTADSFVQAGGRLGSVIGPLIRMTQPLLAPVVYGVLPIASSLILFFLPETRGFPLPDTMQDLENQKSAAAKGNQRQVVITESTSF